MASNSRLGLTQGLQSSNGADASIFVACLLCASHAATRVGPCMFFVHQVVSKVVTECTHVAGAKRLIPEAWRRHKEFDNIHKLDGVAVITVQLRYNGWITEMQDSEKTHSTSQVCVVNHLLQCDCIQASCAAIFVTITPAVFSLAVWLIALCTVGLCRWRTCHLLPPHSSICS